MSSGKATGSLEEVRGSLEYGEPDWEMAIEMLIETARWRVDFLEQPYLAKMQLKDFPNSRDDRKINELISGAKARIKKRVFKIRTRFGTFVIFLPIFLYAAQPSIKHDVFHFVPDGIIFWAVVLLVICSVALHYLRDACGRWRFNSCVSAYAKAYPESGLTFSMPGGKSHGQEPFKVFSVAFMLAMAGFFMALLNTDAGIAKATVDNPEKYTEVTQRLQLFWQAGRFELGLAAIWALTAFLLDNIMSNLSFTRDTLGRVTENAKTAAKHASGTVAEIQIATSQLKGMNEKFSRNAKLANYINALDQVQDLQTMYDKYETELNS